MKMKCSLLFLLFAVVFFDAQAQLPDSVQLNGEWRYVYPVEEKIPFRYAYYSYFDLTEDDYGIWLEWKVNNDLRADLKLKELKPAIHLERIARKEIPESEYYGDVKTIHIKRGFTRFIYRLLHPFRRRNSFKPSKINLHKYPNLAFGTMSAVFPVVPPVVRNLPDGKYVQYFEPRISVDKRKHAVVEDSVIACVFELSHNNLNGLYIRKEWNGDTLCEGSLKDGFQEGFWTVTKEKSYNSYRNGREFYTFWNTEERFYQAGVLEGEMKTYDSGILKGIREYKNGEVFGVRTELNWQDSIVFDVRTALDPDFYNLSNFNLNVHEIILRSGHFGKYDLDDVYKYSRWDEELMKELSSYSNGGLLPPAADSLFEDPQYARFTKYNPIFNSFYRIYDRKTKQLLFSRTLDTVANRIVGSSRKVNGELLDTIYYNYNENYLEHICYDNAGKVFWKNGAYFIDSSKLKTEKIYVIDGIPTHQAGRFGYGTFEEFQRNDTLFTNVFWDKKKQLSSYEFVIDDTEEEGSVLYDGTAKYFSRELDHNHTFEYTDNGLFIQLTLNDQSREKGQKIILNGQNFTGELVFNKDNRQVITLLEKDNKIVLGTAFRNSIFDYRNREIQLYSESIPPLCFSDFLLTSLLNVRDLESGCRRISGNYQNGVFEGDVRFDIKKLEPFTLNYINGFPNGNGTSRYYSGYMPYGHADSLGNELFETKRSSSTYVSDYFLKNGQLDGEVKLFTTNYEQFASLNYKNGKLDGPLWLYCYDHKLTATFREGVLVDNLQISRVSFPGSDQYESEIQLVQTATGELLEGIYEYETSDSDPTMMYFQTRREKWVTKAIGDGNYETNLFDNKELYESRIQKNQYLSQTNGYLNGILSHSKYYADSVRIQDSKILVLRNMLNRTYDFSISSPHHRFGGVDLNLTPWGFDPYPAIALNFIQNYSSETLPYYFKKYYPTGLVSREGPFEVEFDIYHVTVKQGLWKYNDYEGRKIREINFKDSLVNVAGRNFDVKGSVVEFDSLGKVISERFLLEEIEHYECSNDDYYSERQYITVSSINPALKNGFVRNYYDNGALMNEGTLVEGLPNGLWKFYTPDGKLARLGAYVMGQKNGKWLTGDLSEKAYVGDVCIDPNNPDYDVVLHNLEEDKEIKVDIYKMGALLNGKVFSEMGNTQRSGSNTF